MELRTATSIVKTLAQGIHPTTGEAFDPESLYNDPRIIRALFTIHEFVRKAKKPKLTAEERRRENIEFGRPQNAGLPWTNEDRAAVASGFKNGQRPMSWPRRSNAVSVRSTRSWSGRDWYRRISTN